MNARDEGRTSPGRRGIDPVVTLLGDSAAAGGPWALLGLAPGPVTDQQVAAALERRLQQVERHPLGGVPEADDVRLALHAAAAQVLHPQVRASLLGSVKRAANHDPQAAAGRLEIDPFLRIIAMHGGVNERSLRQMMLVAATKSRSPTSLVTQIREMLVAWSHGRRERPGETPRPLRPEPPQPEFPAPQPFTGEAAMPAPTPADVEPGVRAIKVLVLSSLAVIAAAAVVVLGALLLLNKPKPVGPWIPEAPSATPSSRPTGELFPSASEPPATSEQAAGNQGGQATAAGADDPVAMVRAIAHAAANVATGPESSLDEFNASARGISTRWHRLAQDELGLVQDSIVEFLYRAPTPEIAESALDSLSAEPSNAGWTHERVLGEVWRSGILSRLARERDLPSELRSQIDRRHAPLASGVGRDSGTFIRGGLARLSSLPAELIVTAPGAGPVPPSPAQAKVMTAAWQAWKIAARRLCGPDDEAFDRMMIGALETVLTRGPEPAADYGLGEVVKDLVLSASWRRESLGRRWLIASFSSPDLTTADLELVTRTLVADSGSEGVLADMVLAASADEKSRLELRERYATAWGLSDPARRDELVESWKRQVALAEQPVQIDRAADAHHAAALAAAVTKARLNHAAAMVWAGLIDEPAKILADPGVVATRLMTQSAGGPPPKRIDEGGTDGAWAVQYLVAEHRVPERLKLLTELLRSTRPPGQVDAAIVVAEAVRGSPESVRSAARDVADRWGASPAVLYAMLQESYRIPKTRTNADLVASLTLQRLPSLKDPAWYAGVRRALVDRLLQVLASASPQRAIDFLADELGATCAGRARPADAALDAVMSSTPASRRSIDREHPSEAVEDLLGHWRRTAEPLLATGREPFTIESVERRLHSRMALASGSVQEFAARHLAVAELMAYVVAVEQPARATDVVLILDTLATERRAAEHVLDQINAAEHAMLRLWRIRLEGGLS